VGVCVVCVGVGGVCGVCVGCGVCMLLLCVSVCVCVCGVCVCVSFLTRQTKQRFTLNVIFPLSPRLLSNLQKHNAKSWQILSHCNVGACF